MIAEQDFKDEPIKSVQCISAIMYVHIMQFRSHSRVKSMHFVFFDLLIDYAVPTGTAVNGDCYIVYLEPSPSSH